MWVTPLRMLCSSVAAARAYTSSIVNPGLTADTRCLWSRAAAPGRGAPIDDARLVEVDVGLDETRGHEAAVGVKCVGHGLDPGLDGSDPTAGDSDVDERCRVPAIGALRSTKSRFMRRSR